MTGKMLFVNLSYFYKKYLKLFLNKEKFNLNESKK